MVMKLQKGKKVRGWISVCCKYKLHSANYTHLFNLKNICVSITLLSLIFLVNLVLKPEVLINKKIIA